MKAKPIIFSTKMIQALLNTKPDAWPVERIDTGKPFKSMTRRVLKPHNPVKAARMGEYKQGNGLWVDDKKTVDAPNGYIKDYSISSSWMSREFYISKYAPYQTGDILWVRETWTKDKEGCGFKVLDNGQVFYDDGSTKWKPSIFMPRDVARIFLQIKNVRLERVRKISGEDAIAEGAVNNPHYIRYGGEDCLAIHGRYRKDFAKLWDSLNAKRGYSWDSNPWVWVYEFMRIEKQEG